jgi:hypothetical protein
MTRTPEIKSIQNGNMMGDSKIKLDLVLSPNDISPLAQSTNERSIKQKKNSLYLQKRKQIISRCFRQNQSPLTNKFRMQTIALMEQNKQLAKSNNEYLSLIQVKNARVAELTQENFQLKEYCIYLEEGFESMKETLLENITNTILSKELGLKKFLNSRSSISHLETENFQNPKIYEASIKMQPSVQSKKPHCVIHNKSCNLNLIKMWCFSTRSARKTMVRKCLQLLKISKKMGLQQMNKR